MRGSEGQAARIFGETADPSFYVPRQETERVLAELGQRVSQERSSAWLTTPPGIGKSMLLQVLAQRIEGRERCVYLPYAALELRDICRWVIGRLGLSPHPRITEQLASVAREYWADSSALVLLIDDANAMPLQTARALGQLVRRLGGALPLVLASADDARASRAQAALALDLMDVRLLDPMSADETRDYVDTRLRAADAGLRLRKHFDERTVASIHRVSGGVPRRVHDLAFELVSGRALQPAALDSLEVEVHVAPPDGVAPMFEVSDRWDVDPRDLEPAEPGTGPLCAAPGDESPGTAPQLNREPRRVRRRRHQRVGGNRR